MMENGVHVLWYSSCFLHSVFCGDVHFVVGVLVMCVPFASVRVHTHVAIIPKISTSSEI
jgi:hypothetical protein